MTTRADQYRANALHEVGEDYVWGAEGAGGVAGNDDYDCSGFTWAMLNDVGVKMSRTTADGYMRKGVKIAKPSKVGADFAVLDTNGHAHHIIPYIGLDDTVEAKGKAWGVVRGTVASANARGAKWYRFPNVDLGALTSANPAPTVRAYPGHMVGLNHQHHDEVRWVQKRLNAHGIKVAVDGDYGKLTAAAVHVFRAKQGTGAWRLGSTVGRETWKRLAK
jgi:hypothetical protein